MKTLIVTSIYSNLWGTEFGGRSSRYHHYRLSLLNMLNMKPTKVICFVPQDELEDLKRYFYIQNNISESLLEFKVFDLKNSKYFNMIKSKKDIETMKTFDRCFEIQYNKFYWVESLSEIHDYDRIYWFDAGLSHSGLFPDCFAYGGSFERNYQFNVFNNLFLDKINEISKEKFLIVCKNNTEEFYWSVSIPQKYYDVYCKDLHVVGGFFGGTPQKYMELIERFDILLSDLLINEKGLYMEEQIISCLLYRDTSFFETLVFDDWYKKDIHKPTTTLFYQLFLTSEDCSGKEVVSNVTEEVVANIELKNIDELTIEVSNYSTVFAINCFNKNNVTDVKNLIDVITTSTDYDLLLLTDFVDDFADNSSNRLKIIKYSDYFSDKKHISNFLNFHTRRHLISICKKLNYDLIVFCNDNVVLSGWDNNSFNRFSNQDFDIAFVRNIEPQLGYLRTEFKHYQEILDNEFDSLYNESYDVAPNPEVFFHIIKNSEKINTLLTNWELLSEKNKDRFATHYEGVYIGILSVMSDLKMIGISNQEKFTNFISVKKDGGLFDFSGNKIN